MDWVRDSISASVNSISSPVSSVELRMSTDAYSGGS